MQLSDELEVVKASSARQVEVVKEQFEAQSGDLSDAQLFTLFVWAHGEWQRARKRQFSLPVNGHSLQFVTVQERPWRMEENE